MNPADPHTPRRTHPLGIIVGMADGLRRAVIPAAAGLYALREDLPAIGLIPLFLLLVLAIGALSAFLRWWRTTYTVGTEDIRLEQGVISRAARSVPFERIQDVSLEANPVARLLGLVAVRFETGAGGKDEIALTYLPEAEGARLRQLVRERREEAAPTAETATDEEPEGETIFAMGPRRLIVFGLFEFSLAVVAVVAGAAQQLDFLLPFDPWDFEGWQERLAGPGAWLAGLGRGAQVVGGAIAVASLLALGFATGLARTFARDWGFRLDRTPRGFRRRRGLFTRTDTVMPAHRVQALSFSTRVIRRRFGWHGLRFVSLAQDSGAASHDVAPFAKWGELEPIARAAGFDPPDEAVDWRRSSARYRVDGAVIGSFLAVAIGALVAVALRVTEAAPPWLALVVFGVAVAVPAWQALLWRFERHALDARQLYARRGWLAPKTDVTSRVKLQSVEIVQGPIARRRGYATLHLGLAGGTLAIEGLPIGRARELREAILESIAATDFSRLELAQI